jgi:hypothetical protein
MKGHSNTENIEIMGNIENIEKRKSMHAPHADSRLNYAKNKYNKTINASAVRTSV